MQRLTPIVCGALRYVVLTRRSTADRRLLWWKLRLLHARSLPLGNHNGALTRFDITTPQCVEWHPGCVLMSIVIKEVDFDAKRR